MSRWTLDGWVNNFGGWWSVNRCRPQAGLGFHLDSRAREHETDCMQVLRAQWIGDALGEEDVRLSKYGKGGGFWNGLAFYKKQAVVDAVAKEQAAAEAELAKMTAEESRLLGESDEILGDDGAIDSIVMDEEDRRMARSPAGMITIPVAACTKPTNSTDKVVFMRGWNDEVQVHYSRLGQRPELLRYDLELPVAGKYQLVGQISTVSPVE